MLTKQENNLRIYLKNKSICFHDSYFDSFLIYWTLTSSWFIKTWESIMRKTHNLFVSNPIWAPFVVLFKGCYKPSSERESSIYAVRVYVTKFLSILPFPIRALFVVLFKGPSIDFLLWSRSWIEDQHTLKKVAKKSNPIELELHLAQ